MIFYQFSHEFPPYLSSIQLQDYEALGLAGVVGSLILFSPFSAFKALPPELLQSFVQNLTQLTCNFGQAAAREEAVSGGPIVGINSLAPAGF